MNSQMRFSQEALRKLTAAIEQNASVYLYGATGFGKTSVAERALDRACWTICIAWKAQCCREKLFRW